MLFNWVISVRCQAISRTNVHLLPIRPSEIHFKKRCWMAFHIGCQLTGSLFRKWCWMWLQDLTYIKILLYGVIYIYIYIYGVNIDLGSDNRLPKTILTLCHLDPHDYIVKFESKCNFLIWKKGHLKIVFANFCAFCSCFKCVETLIDHTDCLLEWCGMFLDEIRLTLTASSFIYENGVETKWRVFGSRHFRCILSNITFFVFWFEFYLS